MMKFTIERKSSLERFEAQNLAQCYIEILIMYISSKYFKSGVSLSLMIELQLFKCFVA